MNTTKNISGWQFAAFRILFGAYLAWHFAALIPFAAELFSAEGVLPKASLNLTYRAFPNFLAWADSPVQTQLFLLALTLASLAFVVGWQRRIMAVVLWYGWACLFNRNNLISNPGIPYVGLLLILCAIIPTGEPLVWRGRRDPEWRMPAMVFWGAWFLLAAGYTYSGVWKLVSPSWQDGSALCHLLANPLARPGIFRDLLMAMPWPVLAGMTWFALVGELLFLLLSLNRTGRLIAWTWMLMMHLGILLVVDFADLTLGVLMAHIFTFDPDWLRARSERKAILLFDGDCGLCDGAVQFLNGEDAQGALRYAPLQGKLGREFIQQHRLESVDSMVLIESPATGDECAYTRSDAVIRALMVIGGFWKLAAFLVIIPKPARDAIYRAVAKRRYDWFGRAGKACALPSVRLREQLVEKV